MDMHVDTVGVRLKQITTQYLVCPPFASRRATHLLRIELKRLTIVACGMLFHSSSRATRSWGMLSGTGTRSRTRRSRTSHRCSMGDMSGEYAGQSRTGMCSASRSCIQIPATWGRALSCWALSCWKVTSCWRTNGTTIGVRISSQYICPFKFPSMKCKRVLCPLVMPAHTMTPPPP